MDEIITLIVHTLNDFCYGLFLFTDAAKLKKVMRVHSLLEALQPHFSDIPILVMYPGEFDGH